MKHARYLRDLLRPLGVYDLNAPFNGGELDVQGEQLDKIMAWLEGEYPAARRFRLEVTQANQEAVRLYQRAGYEFLHYDQMVLDKIN